jgi:hypothetical protein
MARSEFLILRVDTLLKERIATAASRLGQNVSTFVLQATEKAVAKVEAMPAPSAKPAGKGACPTWFAARCSEAVRGGAGGYGAAGLALARGLAALAPWEQSTDEWAEALADLGELLHVAAAARTRPRPDPEAVWAWLARYLPRCAALIPRRRRNQFIEGIVNAVYDGTISLRV